MHDTPGRYPVPWITQFATPSLIQAIAYEGHPPADDPAWQESGAPDQETYGRWCTRLCGMACLRMALAARDGHAPSLFTLLEGCLESGGYVEEPDGRVTGLIYRPFTDFTRERYQLQADIITGLGPARLISELAQGRLVMASVHKEIRRPERNPPATGGHLVLATGYANGQVSFHNPSGHTRQAGIATLPMPVFDRFAAHRGVSLHVQRASGRPPRTHQVVSSRCQE